MYYYTKYSIVFFLFFISYLCCFGQKPTLGLLTYNQWPVVNNQSIHLSNDGKYFSYTLNIGKDSIKNRISSLDGTWKFDFSGNIEGDFSENSKFFVYRNLINRKLGVINLDAKTENFIEDVDSFRLPLNCKENRIIYARKTKNTDLIIFDLYTHKEKKISNIEYYSFNEANNALIAQKEKDIIGVDLATENFYTIKTNCQLEQAIFNNRSDAIAILGQSISKGSDLQLLYYHKGSDSAKVLIDSNATNMYGKSIAALSRFDYSGNKIFFYLKNKTINSNKAPNSDSLNVHIITYRSKSRITSLGTLEAVTNLNSPQRFILLQKEGDNHGLYFTKNEHDKYEVYISDVIGPTVGKHRQNWPNNYLINTDDGSRKLIAKRTYIENINFSPSGKFLLWYNPIVKNWFAYKFETGVTRNITAKLKVQLHSSGGVWPGNSEGIAGWFKNDGSVLLYDRYDIWKIDPDGCKSPVNITNYYGRRNKIQLRYLDLKVTPGSLIDSDKLILFAFDTRNNDNGFYTLTLTYGNSKLVKLAKGPYSIYSPNSANNSNTLYSGDNNEQFRPIKAKYANVFIIRRMSSEEYPNIYATTNFKRYTKLTFFNPNKGFNWYTTQLLKWKLKNRVIKGILFKPENFNNRKKYPVIFFYYEGINNGLNTFLSPQIGTNPNINIPWFVSNGYIVFVPDIEYHIGHPGQSALEVVTNAAHLLAKNKWIDVNHIGLEGHSFGGFETNYIVSHTSMFAAAVSASAVSNIIDRYTLTDNTRAYYETGQGRIGATLWEQPSLYIENSPILRADKVNTPLLIMHNTNDGSVPYQQGLAWYNALSCLQKKVWMISYEKEGHGLKSEKNQIDYAIRLSEFFGHYLKNKQVPDWMNTEKDTIVASKAPFR